MMDEVQRDDENRRIYSRQKNFTSLDDKKILSLFFYSTIRKRFDEFQEFCWPNPQCSRIIKGWM